MARGGIIFSSCGEMPSIPRALSVRIDLPNDSSYIRYLWDIHTHTHTYIYTHNPRNIIDIMILVYVIKICPNKAQHHNSTLDFRASHQVGIVLRLQFQGFRDMLLRSDPMGMLPTTGKLRYTRYFWYVFFFFIV